MCGLPGPEQGTIKNGMGNERPPIIFIGKLEPPGFNSLVPTGVDKGHIVGSLSHDQKAMAKIKGSRLGIIVIIDGMIAARKVFPRGQRYINAQYPLGIGLPLP
jgi:hypothetical protein